MYAPQIDGGYAGNTIVQAMFGYSGTIITRKEHFTAVHTIDSIMPHAQGVTCNHKRKSRHKQQHGLKPRPIKWVIRILQREHLRRVFDRNAQSDPDEFHRHRTAPFARECHPGIFKRKLSCMFA